MKVPPKRKGNPREKAERAHPVCLNESPSEKEGKWWSTGGGGSAAGAASMKVPPKRKGNAVGSWRMRPSRISLNESPSEKEGKS